MFSNRLLNMTPYTPGEQPQDKKYIKLNTNENPYPPAPQVKKILKRFAFNHKLLRLYPDPQSSKLRQAIAKYYNLNEKNVFIGNGSDEILAMSFFAFFDSANGKLLFPMQSYSFYPVYCNFYGIEYEKVLLEEDFSINIENFLKTKSCGAIITNPNAPTSLALSLDKIRELLDKWPSDKVLVIDEAYVDFGTQSAVELIKRYKNLLVVQTFSKGRSLAGLRLGFALGDEKLVEALTTAKDSFNSYPADRIAQALGVAAIENKKYFLKTTNKIIKTRDNFTASLRARNFSVLESKANFIFCKHPYIAGEEFYKRLKAKGILVRWFSNEQIKDFTRITIGTDKEMKKFLEVLNIIEEEFNGSK